MRLIEIKGIELSKLTDGVDEDLVIDLKKNGTPVTLYSEDINKQISYIADHVLMKWKRTVLMIGCLINAKYPKELFLKTRDIDVSEFVYLETDTSLSYYHTTSKEKIDKLLADHSTIDAWYIATHGHSRWLSVKDVAR